VEVLTAVPRRAPSIVAALALAAVLAVPAAALAADPPGVTPAAAPPAAAPPVTPAAAPPVTVTPVAAPPVTVTQVAAPPVAAPPAPARPVAAPPAPAKRPATEEEMAALFETARLPSYAPAILTYEDGMPIPPGYRLETRRRRSLMAAGAALFGASYLASALTAGTVVAGYDKHRMEVAPLFIPFAGPFVTLSTSRDVQLNDPDRRTNGALLIVDGVAQITGAALFIAGAIAREPILARTKASYLPEEASATPELFLGGRSATLRWRF
jgi:hypothetical protein